MSYGLLISRIFGQNKDDGRPLPLYLAIVLDLFSRRIVGWSMAPTLERTLVMAALQMAIMIRIPAEGLMHHSDRGHHGMEANMPVMIIKKCCNRAPGAKENSK
jgi:transposase InsO family protein